MNAETFNKRLAAINEGVRKSVLKLVNDARNDKPGPVEFADNPQTERAADNLCEFGAWIHDRLHDRDGRHRKSTMKKVRKALGYTFA